MEKKKPLIDIFSVSFNEIGKRSLPSPKKSRIVRKTNSADKRESQ